MCMKSSKLEKDLIFYSPNKPGAVFIYKAGYFVDQEMIKQTADHLKYDTENEIKWVEDRRINPRDA